MTNLSTAVSDGGGTTALTTDERHWLLASKERRAILAVLGETELPVTVRQLATAVVDEAQTASSVDRFVTKCHHNHLPLLDRLGVVQYDHDRSTVTAYRPIVTDED
jgi:predicted transcriptional regulator